MDPIKATLRSKTDPALGSVTIQFPIHRKEYDRVLEQLKPLDIGSLTRTARSKCWTATTPS